MLTRPRLGDDACFAHAAGEKNLAKHIVYLMRAGVVQFLALEVDFGVAWPTGSGGSRGAPRRSAARRNREGSDVRYNGQADCRVRLRWIRLGGVVVFLEIEDQR
jgi:hypothetical protein